MKIKDYIIAQLIVVFGIILKLWGSTLQNENKHGIQEVYSLRIRISAMIRRMVNLEKKAVIKAIIENWISQSVALYLITFTE